MLVVLTVLFYMEENWRGRSAWANARQKLQAVQEKLDWADYIPPTVPDDQNFFKAPGMSEWFTGRGTNELTARLSLNTFVALALHRANTNASVMVTELIIRPPGTGTSPPESYLAPAEILPLVTLDNVTLSEAIGQLCAPGRLERPG